MSRKPVDLGVPEHARREWDALHTAIEESWTTTPCAGPDRDLWQGSQGEQKRAANRCYDCSALALCDAYADAADERMGVWGGITARERGARAQGRRK